MKNKRERNEQQRNCDDCETHGNSKKKKRKDGAPSTVRVCSLMTSQNFLRERNLKSNGFERLKVGISQSTLPCCYGHTVRMQPAATAFSRTTSTSLKYDVHRKQGFMYHTVHRICPSLYLEARSSNKLQRSVPVTCRLLRVVPGFVLDLALHLFFVPSQRSISPL